jgi:hypothetical protein
MPPVLPQGWSPAISMVRRHGAMVAWSTMVCVILTALMCRSSLGLPIAQSLPLLLRTLSLNLGVLAPMLLALCVGHRRLPRSGAGRWIGLMLLAVLLGAGGAGLRYAEAALFGGRWAGLRIALDAETALAMLLLGVRECAFRSARAHEALNQGEAQRRAVEHQLSLARLQVLHAQVEPHFLFNSLANVRRLLRTDPPAVRAMLADLLHYLAHALPRLREERTTLGVELELACAFLSICQVRMGARLCIEVDVPAGLSHLSLPPMTLLTLVENALKHGLQPLPEGGLIRIVARCSDGSLLLTVADTGCGMGNASGHGTGLANLRARLSALYGGAGRLSFRINEPRGVVVTVALPELVA